MPFPIGRDADRLRDTVDEIVGIITPIVRVDAVLDDHAVICPELVEALRHDSVELVLRNREYTARGAIFRAPDVVHITRIITNQSLSNPLSVLIVADNAVQIAEQVLSDLLPLRFHGLQVNIGFAGQQPILIEMVGSLRHKSVGLLLWYVPVAVRRRTLDTVYGSEIVNIPVLVFGKSDRLRHAVDEVIGMVAPVMRVDTVLDDHAVIRSELVEALRHDSVELVLRDREHTARGTVDRIPNVVDISLVVPDQPLCHRDTVFVVADPSVCIMYQSGYRRSGSISSRGCRQRACNRKSQQTQRRQPSHNFFHIVSPFAPHRLVRGNARGESPDTGCVRDGSLITSGLLYHPRRILSSRCPVFVVFQLLGAFPGASSTADIILEIYPEYSPFPPFFQKTIDNSKKSWYNTVSVRSAIRNRLLTARKI